MNTVMSTFVLAVSVILTLSSMNVLIVAQRGKALTEQNTQL